MDIVMPGAVMHAGGRPRNFKSPEHLWKIFKEYVEWAKINPWLKKDFIRSGDAAGSIVDLETERPLTEWEFASFCGLSHQGLKNYGSIEEYKEFFAIYARIKTFMTAQRISGGLVDAYNARLVARIDGIAERVENTESDVIVNAITELMKRLPD